MSDQNNKAIKTATFGIDPQKAIHSELGDQTDHLESISESTDGSNKSLESIDKTLKEPLTVKMEGEEGKKIKNAGDFISNFLESVKVEKGEQGNQGEQGEKGDAGEQGEQGIPGEKGDPGESGKDGSPGEPGQDGRDGKDGKDGIDGKNGIDGIDAVTPKISELAQETIKAIKNLPENEKLDITHLRNSAQLQSAIGKANSIKSGSGFKFNGTNYKFEEFMHGGGGGGSVSVTFNYETPLTGTLGSSTVYTFTHNIGQLVLNNATQDPNLDYTGQGTKTATFGFTPTGTSLLNIYLS